MLFNIIKQSFLNQKKAMVLVISSISMGAALLASLLSLSLDISRKVSRELRSFGANIIVKPKIAGLAGIAEQRRYLNEDDIVKIKTIFWRHNILGIVPFLYVKDEGKDITIAGTWYKEYLKIPGERETFVAGISKVMPWWQISGRWPEADNEIAVGASLAERLKVSNGSKIVLLKGEFTITGIINTGNREDDMAITNLKSLQRYSGLNGKVSTVYVSALTTPMDDFAYKDPEDMTRKEYEKWYCTGYVTSIAKQIEEVMKGSVARPIWTVAETEGKVLKRLRLLIYLLATLTFICAALSVSTTMVMSLLRRTHEVALMKTIGADRFKTVSIFLLEALMLGLAGGLVGYLFSLLLAGYIGYSVFGTAFEQHSVLLPISMVSSVIISIMGSYLPIKRALKIKPAVVLRGE